MTRRIVLALTIGVLGLPAAALLAQSGAKNGEWRSYAGDTGSTRYSPLDQINAANFNKLEVAWRFKTDSLGPRPEFQYEGTPLMANGVLYATGGKPGASPKSFHDVKGYGRGFDVRTGKRLWIFHTIPQQGEFGVETWEKESWVYTGNTGVWGQISIDEDLGLAYLPVEMPTGD